MLLLFPNLNKLPELDEGVTVSSILLVSFSSLFILLKENKLVLLLGLDSIVFIAGMVVVVAVVSPLVSLIESSGCLVCAILFMKLANVLDESLRDLSSGEVRSISSW